MTFYFTVNGVPACSAKETLDPRISPPSTCSHTTEEGAEEMANGVRKWYPDADIRVVEGDCPRPDEYDKYAEQVVDAIRKSIAVDVDAAKKHAKVVLLKLLEYNIPFSEMENSCRVAFDISYDKENETINFHPKNLFTGLLLIGRYVPWHELQGKDEYADLSGTKFKVEDGQLYVTPVKPLDFLKLNITLGEGKE